ncbi:carbohydrate ABC transporter permease [Paenibacillus lautus]|uniref:Carbohydrate ABC transporter permease n=1 Tax=Paenibacillus lautus TaxID=1401 RepID=A0A2A5LC48_PAELA|nr:MULTISPECIES: carbohydrate ABC transporter permease [Paenibacillus]MBY0160031.1 carbohydrate ABC transporter permease [Cytobacillus firmus]ACX66521.1 binding-protein-dependent transport systems inner membrane component [Paenibacillus sp. Y412MC10]AYB43371.1 carbohydrate ABC transporter permease [Paenibacillus lautus]EGG38006.1 ABC transporter, permease protein [Paenibacillus sp. HGF5]ETT61120.1 binding-protein-dependent transport systems inner membrane component [Paenibacillus sp. FSL H8-45
MTTSTQAEKASRLAVHILLAVGALLMIMPFLWMISTSFKSFADSMSVPPKWLPVEWHPDNYLRVIQTIDFGTYYLNTVIVTVGRTAGQLILCSLAAYAFASLRFPFKNAIFLALLAVLMVPSQVVMIPSFVIMREFNWLDTFYVLIVPGIFSAFGTFLLRQFFMTLPKDLEEAAKIDGCSYFRIYWNIYLPLSKAALVSLAIFTILASWNDLLWPLIMTSSEEMRVLSIGISSFQGQHSTDYPLLMAGALMATLPIIILFIFLQRYFIEGIAMNGIKG